MAELHRGRARALYGQVELLDVEDVNSNPEWSSGEESLVFGPKGVAVAAAIDQLIEIRVLQGAAPTNAAFYGSGDILVGNSGILVGNFVAGTTATVPWPPGKVKVDVFGNGPVSSATQIIFVLTPLGV